MIDILYQRNEILKSLIRQAYFQKVTHAKNLWYYHLIIFIIFNVRG